MDQPTPDQPTPDPSLPDPSRQQRKPSRTELAAQLMFEMRRIQPRLPESWPNSANFRTDLHLDSLDLIELIARMEQQTGVLVEDEDLQLMVSLDAITDYLLARMP